MKTAKYVRKPFVVEAVQVTEENLFEVAQWCGGEIRTKHADGRGVESYIKVHVHRPLTERQTEARVGDWVLFAGKASFKVYTPKAFETSFELEQPVSQTMTKFEEEHKAQLDILQPKK